MWDERYSTDDYAYGTAPNGFLADNVAALPKGRVLSLAEGEGRNAVFLATQGYAVTAVDASRVGLEKAGRLAEAHGVAIERVHADLAEFDPGEACWDGVVSIFCPLPSVLRKALHRKVVAALKPGGVFVLEAYTPAQLQHRTGGGSSADTMVTAAMLHEELAGLDFRHLRELEREVIEGTYHTGLGAVVQLIAAKPV
ncbi:bifunctional 2-polyprenyl-6-hydroxyphenol methylase/3-demethylubiquinol 3-O-methyltransferase UbiG [Jeongeupia sp. USM3]|uniref:class I SAM-dependent methyltransferase n=1 Tax=Jeongeupia sp. USM3 TaxID=1906741 RepID=UPI00089DF740|nr:class I SAM-dependent methyltransferase [Jeongeupia sp. USM3]AOY02024.1 SAM-dependent methyltransferase [Jeongeupia sp. USM3]